VARPGVSRWGAPCRDQTSLNEHERSDDERFAPSSSPRCGRRRRRLFREWRPAYEWTDQGQEEHVGSTPRSHALGGEPLQLVGAVAQREGANGLGGDFKNA
jgi:hypothetical protein